MLAFSVALLAALCFNNASAQDWSPLWSTAQLSQARWGLAATSAGNDVFFAGGVAGGLGSSGYSNVVDIYNTSTGIWSTATLAQARFEFSATSAGNEVFFAGGDYGDWTGPYSNVVDIYNTSTGVWSAGTLSLARDGLAATSAGNQVLFAGGFNWGSGGYDNVVDIYNTSTNTWSTSSLSQARNGLATTSAGNQVFFGGGAYSIYSNGPSNVVDIYNASAGTWSTATLSQARWALSAASAGGEVFFGGGTTNGSSVSNLVDICNASAGTWSTATLSQARYALAAASVGNEVLFGGGYNGGSASNVVDIYNTSTGVWSTSSLSQARQQLTAASVGNQVFFAGGMDSSGNPSSVVDIYTLQNYPSISSTKTFTLCDQTTVAGLMQLNAPGSLSFATFHLNVGSMSGNAPIDLGNQTLTVGSDNTSTTYSGIISDAGSLVKTGNGMLVLTGSNSYSGGTTVNAGTLQGNAVSLQGNILNNASVVFDQPVPGSYAGSMSGGGSLTKIGNDTLTLSGSSNYTGGTNINQGTLNVTGSLSGGGNVVLASNAALSGSGLVLGNISGAVASTIAASGNLVLGDSTSYTGFNHAGTLTVGPNLVTLDSAGFANLGVLTTLGGGTLAAPNGVSIGVGCNLVGSGVVSGKIAAGYGSTINATGNLTLGDSTSPVGFISSGELYTNANTVTILSNNAANNQNAVVLGSLTQLDGGSLVAPNGILLANGNNLVTTDAGGIISGGSASRFLNRGNVQGPSSASSNWLIFNLLFKGSTGQTSGRIGFLGGFATGDSPGVNTQYGATLLGGSGTEFDIGGTTPGNTNNNYGQLNILANPSDPNNRGNLTLLPGTSMKIVDWNGFVPSVGNAFTVLTWGGTLSGTASLNIDPAFAADGIRLIPVWNSNSLVLDAVYPATAGISAVGATIITGGTAALGATVSNFGVSPAANLNYTLGAVVSSGSATLGPPSPASGSLAQSASQANTIMATSTNLGANTVTLTASDPNSSNGSQSTTATLTVLGHAAPSLSVTSGNSQTVIVGATGINAGLNLANGAAGQSGLASLDVNSLGPGVSGSTGAALVASGSSQSYTAVLDTSTLGTQPQTFSLNVGDDHTLPGASAPMNVAASATLTVLGHAAPSLSVQWQQSTVIVGATGIITALNLSNGDQGQSGLASLDVNSLGAGVSGPTGGALVPSGSSQSYTAALDTSTVGTQTQTFSLNVGDDHTLPGASAPMNLSLTATLTVLGHAAPSLSVSTGNNQTVIVGATGINAGLNLSNGTSGQAGLASMDVNSLGTGVSGSIGGALVASGSSQSYMAALNTSTLGTQTQTFSLNVGDDHTLSGASAPTNVSTGVTLTVLGHAAPSLSVISGNNQTVIVGASGITAGLNLSNGTPGQIGLASLDVNSLGFGVSGLIGGALVASGSTQAYMASLNTSTLGPQTQTFLLNVGDDQTLAGASPPANMSTTATLTVLGHAAPSLSVVSGNNQTVIVGASGITAGLNLSNGTAGQTGLAALDVNSLGGGVSGLTGGALVPSGSTQSYTAFLNTGILGPQTQTFSLNAGDDQSLPGASAPANLSTSATLTVLGHAAPNLSVVGGNNQTVIVGATGIIAGLNLSNGTAGQSGLASLDVNSLGNGVSGAIGGELVASGSSQPYTAALGTSTIGTQVETFSLNVGDDHTLPGASAPTNLSTTATLTVLDHAAGSATVTSGNGLLVHAGTPIISATVSLSNAAGTRSGLEVDFAPTISSGTLSNGPAAPYYISAGSRQAYTAAFNAPSAPGAFSDTVTFASVGDKQSLPGANSLGSLSVSITGNVYSGKAEWNTTTGLWATSSNWTDTVGGGPSGPPGLSGYATDTATFGTAVSSDIVVVALNSAAPVLSNLIFDNPNTSYWILQTGSTGLKLTGSDGSSPAAVTVVSGTHLVDASVLLASNLAVSSSGSLTVSGNISDGGMPKSLTLEGPDELVLSGSNTYTGGTFVDAGTLVLDSNTALANGSSLTVGDSASLAFDLSSAAASPTISSAVSPIVEAVPEPGTLMLLGVCALGLLGYGWRRRKRAA
jgi:autotransporter-associated beta strand protein